MIVYYVDWINMAQNNVYYVKKGTLYITMMVNKFAKKIKKKNYKVAILEIQMDLNVKFV